ncbi:hypothetical protein SAMN05421664_0483 [Chryseobacterium soldanellicola]|uniref:Uncharacterized protein n=1 Tax=Chryseobacterium soldanellicola TaxID=311333 RepID=A0A1H0Y4S6_9FLAO|nr:hypothetical protein [Chryseobacterium soldanellicola]SDQ10138.1 hypothetical protein SAMN05421664_0483 [Chryseobacterium soldanellicola]
MKAKVIAGVPQQKKGGFHDTESEKTFDNPAITSQKFEILKERFLSVNNWKKYCGKHSADFKLFDAYGNFVDKKSEIGDFIRIDIPGPGDVEAKGYDWVQIISMFDEEDDNFAKIIITCRPSVIPDKKKHRHIAHFYSDKASSTFIISREGNVLKTGVYGRNETPNFNTGFLNKIRNIFITLGGIAGISKIQWKTLSDGLLDFE